MRKLLVLLCCAFGLSSNAIAQEYTTSTWLNLRARPSKNSTVKRVIERGEKVTVRDANPHPGWVPVTTEDDEIGWVSEVYLIDPAVALAAADTRLNSNNGAAFTRIDPNWDKPTPKRTGIRVKEGDELCRARGDGGDTLTNRNKNRADDPDQSYLVTVDAIRALPDTALWRHTRPHNTRFHWTESDLDLVEPYEGISVTVEGYFEIVKPQKTSAPKAGKRVGESTNCHAWSENDTDWHIALVADPSETEAESVVIEPTPRLKRHNKGWDPATAKELAVRKAPSSARNEDGAKKVRVTGFLMLDPAHPDHIGKFRATLWELHPVTRIEVWDGGRWVDLNDWSSDE